MNGKTLVSYSAMRAVWHPSFDLTVNLLRGQRELTPGDPWTARRIGHVALKPDYEVRKGVFDADDVRFNVDQDIPRVGEVDLIVIAWKQWPLAWMRRSCLLAGGDLILQWDNGPIRAFRYAWPNRLQSSRVTGTRRLLLDNIDQIGTIKEGSREYRNGPSGDWWANS